ncbi:MAG: hypothetical protein ABSG89_09020 [Bacteroidales bacterium]|jgi:hypothetical protein
MKEITRDKDFFIDLSDMMSLSLPLVKMKHLESRGPIKELNASLIDQKLRFSPTVEDGEPIDFVIDCKFRMYLGLGHLKISGKEIIMAGQIKCRNGQVYYINNWSIYCEIEDDQFIDFVKEFRKMDFVIPDLQVEFYNFK